MTPRIRLSGGAIDGEAEAAAVAAVLAVLEAESADLATSPAAPTGWHDTARLLTQGVPPVRLPVAPNWGHIERLRRAGSGGSGIVGL